MRRFPYLLVLTLIVALSCGLWIARSPNELSPPFEPLSRTRSETKANPIGSPPTASTPRASQPLAVPASSSTFSPPSTHADTGAPQTSARSIIASAWLVNQHPAHAAFRAWTERYQAAAASDQAVMEHEGVRLANARRAALADLIVTDPESALASSVPVAIRAALPPAIVARLEARVSGRGELALNAVTPAEGAVAPDEPYFRSAQLDGREYRAYVYGRRAQEATYPEAALVGIAVDNLLAVADSPLRMLEPGEAISPGAPTVTTCATCAAAAADLLPGRAYEYAGRIGVAIDPAHFAADAEALEADNQPGASSVLGRPSQAWTHGPKKVLIIRIVFSDTAGAADDSAVGLSESSAVQRFNGSGGVGDFFAASSFGKTSLVIAPVAGGDSPDVTPVLRLAATAAAYATTGENATLHADARLAADAAGFDLDDYDRIGVVFPSLAAISGSKITYGGLANVIGPNFWINGAYTFRVVAHELGHTYGLRHSNLWKVSDGNPVSDGGTSLEYGDPFDLMGGGEFFSATDDFSLWNKTLLQWIPDAAVTVAEAGGTYRIHRFDDAGADLGLPRALKIVRDPVRDYWIGYRRGTDNPALDGGAYVLWGYNTNKQGDLLDLTTPGSDPEDAALAIGATFTDASAGVTLKPLAQGGSGPDEWLDVQVILQPRIQWIESIVLADEQRGSVTLTLRRSANSAGAISVNYSTVPGTAGAVVDYVTTSGSVTWAAGDTTDKTVVITLTPDAVIEGSETFIVRLSSVVGGVRVGSADATVIISDPGARDTGYVADFINSNVYCVLPEPDGGLLLGGAFSAVSSAARSGVARLDAGGRLDVEFGSGGGTSISSNPDALAPVYELARLPDDRILIIGGFDAFDGVARDGIARLQSDGTLDLGFTPPTIGGGDIQTFLPLPDGRILIGGKFTSIGGQPREYLARLLPNGALDPTFVGPNFEGSSGWRVESLALQSDGKILVGGNFYLSNTATRRSGICRLQPGGTVDSSFTGVTHGAHVAGNTGSLRSVDQIVVQPDGRILIVGAFTAFNNTARSGIARLSSTGSLETNFNPVADLGPDAVLLLPDQSILLGGAFTTIDGVAAPRLARLTAAGVLDASFAAAGRPAAAVHSLALAADGRLYFGGAFGPFQDSSEIRPVWRALPGLAGTAGLVEFSADTYSGKESGSAVLTVRRTGGKLGAIHVGYATARNHGADTATANADYTATTGALVWEDGDDAPKTIAIPLAADGASDEGETFTVRLGGPLIGGVMLGQRREAVVSITAAVAGPQEIDFAPLADRGFTPEPIALAATADSGLPVSFELVSGPATLSGSSLTLTGVGLVTVRAIQAGSDLYEAAAPVERSFTVAQGAQTIDFAILPDRNLGAAPFSLSATAVATSGLPVGFTVFSGPATLEGATLTLTGPGTVVIVASQPGNANYLAAPAVQRSFTVSSVAIITLTNLAQTYAAAPRMIGFTHSLEGDLSASVSYAGSLIAPTEVGTYPVVLTITEPLVSGSASGTLVISKATLNARPIDQRRLVGTANPALSIGYTGLLGDDTSAVLDRVPVAKTTAAKTSKPGTYPISLNGGVDNNYAFAFTPGELRIVGFGGAYEALLAPPAGGDVVGKVAITASATGPGFSGVLDLGAETAPVSIKGGLTLDPPADDDPEDRASGQWIGTAPAPRDYRVFFNLGASGCEVSVYRGEILIAEGQGIRVFAPPPRTAVAWSGPHTAWFDAFTPIAENDLRPLPVGVGHAAIAAPASGVIKLSAFLPEGARFGASLKPDATGGYRVFARPYAKRANSYVAGSLDLAGETAQDFVWVKAAKTGTPVDAGYRGGFALKGRASSARWIPPRGATLALPALTFADALGLDPSSARFSASYLGADLGQSADSLPTAFVLNSATNRVSLHDPDSTTPNPRKFALTLVAKTGAFSGNFTLADTVEVPGKPTATISRKIKFSGVLRRSGGGDIEDPATFGRGFFVIRPLTAGVESESGEIRLTVPTP